MTVIVWLMTEELKGGLLVHSESANSWLWEVRMMRFAGCNRNAPPPQLSAQILLLLPKDDSPDDKHYDVADIKLQVMFGPAVCPSPTIHCAHRKRKVTFGTLFCFQKRRNVIFSASLLFFGWWKTTLFMTTIWKISYASVREENAQP